MGSHGEGCTKCAKRPAKILSLRSAPCHEEVSSHPCARHAGRVIKDFPRDKVKITSKWGAKFTAQGLTKDLRMEACREQCEGSLKRLGVDCLDMFIFRGPPKDDHGTTIEQCVENMKVLTPQ